MSKRLRFLLAAAIATALAATLPLVAPAQTRKPAPKPAARPVARPAAKPAVKPVPKPAAAPPARAAQPAPVPAPPVPAPAPAPREARADGPFGVGTNALNLGIGLGSRYGYGSGLLGGSSSVSPAFSLSYERGVVALGPGVLGVGVFAGYQGASYDVGGGDKWKYTDLIVTLRGAFHYPVTPEFDAYGGLGLGVRRLSSSWSGPAASLFQAAGNASATELTSGLFVGGRYFLTESIGAFAELGYDQTYFKVGLTARF